MKRMNVGFEVRKTLVKSQDHDPLWQAASFRYPFNREPQLQRRSVINSSPEGLGENFVPVVISTEVT